MKPNLPILLKTQCTQNPFLSFKKQVRKTLLLDKIYSNKDIPPREKVKQSKKWIKSAIVSIGFSVLLTISLISFSWSQDSIPILSPLSTNSNNLSAVISQLNLNGSDVFAAKTILKKPVNILLLGVDARKGDGNPRCDAIHMFSFDFSSNIITITSVPRGTVIESLKVASQSAYLGNMCHLRGVKETISEIERITNIESDYVVKVGFSQTLGILRTLKLPTTPTLQFLRNRRYGIGDNQRSRNQALFLKDMFLNYFDSIYRLPKTIKYLAFQIIDTDMPFEVANYLTSQIALSQMLEDTKNITIVTKPTAHPGIKEVHFDKNNFTDLSEWQDEEFVEYQQKLESYLENLIYQVENLIKRNSLDYAYKKISVPFEQQIWLQVEDEQKRNLFHFDLLKLYVLSNKDQTKNTSYLLDFITEMEILKNDVLKKKAEELFETISPSS